MAKALATQEVIVSGTVAEISASPFELKMDRNDATGKSLRVFYPIFSHAQFLSKMMKCLLNDLMVVSMDELEGSENLKGNNLSLNMTNRKAQSCWLLGNLECYYFVYD